MISPSTAIARSPGMGKMTCCENDHLKMDDDGVWHTIPCRKVMVASAMLRMVRKRREYLLGLGDIIGYRAWTAMTPRVMQGLNSDKMPALPSSVNDFLSTFRFTDARNQADQGLTPLQLAAISGNVVVLNELISQYDFDVDARLQMDYFELGAEQGTTALALSAAVCPQQNVHAVVAALIAAGADPNVQTKLGTTPLMAGAVYQSPEAVRALLAYCGNVLDLEKTLKANRATALSLASFMSTAEIVDVLVQAGADRKHVEDGGGSKLTDACSNPDADARMLEVLCRPSDGNDRSRIQEDPSRGPQEAPGRRAVGAAGREGESTQKSSSLRGAMDDTEPVVSLEDGTVRNDEDDASDSTSLLSKSASSGSGSRSSSSSGSVSRSSELNRQRQKHKNMEAAVVQEQPPSTAVTVLPEECERQPADQQCAEPEMQWAIWVVFIGIVLLFCGYSVPAQGGRFYLLQCPAWLCLSLGLIAFSGCPVREGNDIDTWLAANPKKRTFVGGVLTLQSLIYAILALPHLNFIDALIATCVTCYGCIGRNISVAVRPSASTLLLQWSACHPTMVSMHFMIAGGMLEAFGVPPFNPTATIDAHSASIRGGLMGALTWLRFMWLEVQRERFRSTNGVSGNSQTLTLIYSAFGFVATASICNINVALYLQRTGNSTESFRMLCLAACQGVPVLVVTIVGRVRLYRFLAEQESRFNGHASTNDLSLRSNINDRMKPRTLKFKLIDFACRTILRVRGGHATSRSLSLRVMARAHCEGSTPLHFAARAGNVKLVEWLLSHGAEPSLLIKNRMGCRPIDLADLFGPHTEVIGLLGAAMVKEEAAVQQKSPLRLSRKAMMKRLQTSELRAARGGETAIRMQYPMMLMPVHEFMTLSELRPHQELMAAGKLVEWNATMKNIFFLSHQWTSFDRPDHSTAQLRTVQRTLVRMLLGKLPQTAPTFEDAVHLPTSAQISSAQWKELVPHTHVWMDYISVRFLVCACC